MSQSKLRMMLIISPIMMIGGWIIAFAMVIEALQSTFILNFSSYALMFSGFIMGMLGVLLSWNRKKQQKNSRKLTENIDDREDGVPEQYTPFQRKMKGVEEEIKQDLKDRFKESDGSPKNDEE